jgi:hypothetical protein
MESNVHRDDPNIRVVFLDLFVLHPLLSSSCWLLELVIGFESW